MLLNVSIPVAEIANLKPVHCTVLAGLLAFADRAGCCWPGLRKLAEVTGLHLSRVHRAILEMEKAGILTRVKRGAGTLYQLAERFVRQAIRPKGSYPIRTLSEPVERRPAFNSEPAAGSPHGTTNCSASATGCSASATEGESKKELEEDSKRDPGSVRRDAPPVVSPNVHCVQFNHSRDVPETVGMPNGEHPTKYPDKAKINDRRVSGKSGDKGKATINNSRVSGKSGNKAKSKNSTNPPIPGFNAAMAKDSAADISDPNTTPVTERFGNGGKTKNPFARRQWLRTLNTFIGERLKGSLQWAGWEVVAKALEGDSLDRDEQRRLDGLDRMMRGCGYRAGGG